MQKKQLNQKDNFKIFGVTTLLIITTHILPNISRSKGKQTLKFGQVIKYDNEKDFSSKIMQKMQQRDQFQITFCFLKKLYMT